MRHDTDRAVALGAAWVLFVLCCVSPIAWMLLAQGQSGWLPWPAGGLADARQRSLMVNTLVLGGGAALLAFTIGAPAGYVLARCDPRRASLARLILAVPVVLPSYVLGLAWIVLFGGYRSSWVYSMPAAIVVLGFSLYPIVMLTAEAALRSVPARLEEAGHMSAPAWNVFARITVPLTAAALSASVLVAFVLAVSDFAVAGLLRVRVYTTEVFTAFAALYDFRLATVTALPPTGVATLAAIAALHIGQHPLTGRTDRGQSGRRWDQSAQHFAVGIMLIAAAAMVGLPIASVALEARGGRAALFDGVSLEALRNSVVWSGTGASLVVLIGTVLGYSRRSAGPRTGLVAEALWVTLFAVPATIIAVGIIALWNRPGALGHIYRTDAIVVIAYVSRFLPIGALLCGAFLRRVPAGVEEAARVSGASWRRTLIRVIIPMARDGLAAVWLVMFILMLGDVALSILVSPPGESNLAVRAYTLIANSTTGDVARLAMVQIAATLLPLIALALVARRHTHV